MQGPKCKFCGEPHFGLCPKLTRAKVKARVEEIAARPVKLGTKGKAKKAKRTKKRTAKQAAKPQAAETIAKTTVPVMDIKADK